MRPSRHVALGTVDATHLARASHGEEVFILRHGGEECRRSDRGCLRYVCVDGEEGATARWVAIRVFLIIVVVVFCARKLQVYTEVNTGVAIGEASRGADACARDWASGRKEGLAKSKYRGPKQRTRPESSPLLLASQPSYYSQYSHLYCCRHFLIPLSRCP